MRRRFLSTIIVSLTVTLASEPVSFAQMLKVKTANGIASGCLSGKVAVFKGVPYAAAPVGELRWQAPQPAPAWKGELECKTWPASAIQSKPVPVMMWSEEFIAPP